MAAIELPENAGPKTTALADKLQAMLNDPGNSHEALILAAFSGLIPIVAELEHDLAELRGSDS